MGKSKWDKETAVSCVRRNGGTVVGKGVICPKAGIKVLGAINYLVKHCGYIKVIPEGKGK